MEKIEALETISEAWSNNNLSLGEKVIKISSAFYSAGLDLATTAAHVHATPSELDSLLALGELDDGLIEEISLADPPKTTWTMIAHASDDEVREAIKAIKSNQNTESGLKRIGPIDEIVYCAMVEVAAPTPEQLVGGLSGDTLTYARKKGLDFNVIGEWEAKFLKSIAGQKKRGKTLSEKQVVKLRDTLANMVEQGVFKRDSIDGDQAICDEILDALGK